MLVVKGVYHASVYSFFAGGDVKHGGKKPDKITHSIMAVLANAGIALKEALHLKEDIAALEIPFLEQLKNNHLVIIAGGTGITSKDTVPQWLAARFDVSATSLMEAARQYGFERNPNAMLSNGVSGLVGDVLVLNIPGSTSGALETINILLPSIRKVLLNIFTLASD